MSKVIFNYKSWILNTLLDKYEQSSAFQTGVFSRRIMLDVQKEKKLQDIMEEIDEKHLLLADLTALKEQGLIDYSWVKHETGILVDKVWLIPESLDNCYIALERTPAAVILDVFQTLTVTYLNRFQSDSEFALYLKASCNYATTRKKIRLPFTGDMKLNTDLMECLLHLEECPNQMERVFSSRYFGDSKYFERTLKSKIISILKEIQKNSLGTEEDSSDDLLSDEELLIERGLYRWPEIFEFNGVLTFHMDDGTTIDTKGQRFGSYINSDAVKHILFIDGSQIEKVVFIENKANYIDYQYRHKKQEELIIYHGGFYSPMKGMLLSKIYDGCKKALFYHWSDIDLGGFRIFHRLQNNIAPSVRPLYMDVATLQSNAEACIKIKTDSYLQQLSALLGNREYSVFFEVINYMINNRVRLEQENLIT